jgi:hypothetical protein
MCGRISMSGVQDEKPAIQIEHPDYYNQGNIEVLDFIEDQGHLGFCRQTAIKYICRSGKKEGSVKGDDLRKAIYYLEREMGYHRKEEK